MKKLVFLLLALILAAALAGCNTGNVPTANPGTTPGLYAPHQNNVNFNDGAMTTNLATDNPLYAMPNTSANTAG